MTIQILGINDQQAVSILQIAAILDFAVGALILTGILLPFAYSYTLAWGLATSFARLFANVSWVTFSSDFAQWAPEFLHRLPHALIPAAGLALAFPAFANFVRLSQK